MTVSASTAALDLNAPVIRLRGVGPRVAEKLEKLQIVCIRDLLFHLPNRYEDRTRIVALGALRPGLRTVVEGSVELSQIRFGKRRSLLCRISDGTGAITLRFFHFTNAQKDKLTEGVRIRCFGEVRSGPATLEMVHPEITFLQAHQTLSVEETLTPIYPTTEGLHQIGIRKLANQAVNLLDAESDLPELLPDTLRDELGLPALVEALLYLHRPPPDVNVEQLETGQHPAQQRLAFEELLANHLSLRKVRAELQQRAATAMRCEGRLAKKLLGVLGFELTAAQGRVVNEIRHDIESHSPMLRLLQGDVGAGKTVVAALAALQVMECGQQVALMAPTEILAEQHLRNFSDWMQAIEIPVIWLSGKMGQAQRRQALDAIATNSTAMIIGTHALFQDDVEFNQLGLVIVDEQHRFGVHQRLALSNKGCQNGVYPHQLIMTATPIPRTLAMTAYADLDHSIIDELPPNRTPVSTIVIPETRRDEIIDRIQQACTDGRQVYWVCTLIEESEAVQCQAASETSTELDALLDDVRVGLIHGRLKSDEKESVMSAFKQGKLDLLVATTVIEVGVDVPNASLMVIENAERLGLSQLHQLRGRVGRGATKSDCVLMYRSPLSELARARLAVMRETTDGFRIAQRDLELRGPGELLGTRQAGAMQLRIADLIRDAHLLPKVEKTAALLRDKFPEKIEPLVNRWLGNAIHYGHV